MRGFCGGFVWGNWGEFEDGGWKESGGSRQPVEVVGNLAVVIGKIFIG